MSLKNRFKVPIFKLKLCKSIKEEYKYVYQILLNYVKTNFFVTQQFYSNQKKNVEQLRTFTSTRIVVAIK